MFIVLAHWNNSPQIDMSIHPNPLFWFWANQSLFPLLSATYLAENQYVLISQSLVWSDRDWNPRSFALEAYALPVLIRQRLEPTIYHTRGVHTTCVDPTEAGTHDLPHSRRTHYLCGSDSGWNPRSTAPEAYTLPVLIRQRVEPTIYRTRGVHTTCAQSMQLDTVCNYYTVIWSKTRFVLRSILDVSFNTRKCLYDRLNLKYLSCVMKHWHCKNKLISI